MTSKKEEVSFLTRESILSGTEPIVWALRDINTTLENMLYYMKTQNREK